MTHRISRIDSAPWWARGGIALMCIAGAMAVRWLLDPALSDAFQLLTLFGGIALAVWFCGWLAATVVAGAGFAAEHWLIFPRENVAGSPSGLGASFAGYVFSAGAIICIGEAMRRARRRAEQDREMLAQAIAERTRVEASLRVRTEELQVLIDSVPAYVCIAHDAEARLITGNRTMTAVLGLEAGTNVAEIAETERAQLRYFDGEGSPLPVVALPLQRAIATGRPVENAYFAIEPEDGRQRWLAGSATPLFTAGGRIRGAIAVFVDVTEQRAAQGELQQAHALLRDRAKHLESLVEARTAKLIETVGELEAFSYSISHDMRAPLRAMQGFAQLLRDEGGSLNAAGKDYVQRIMRAAERMDRLIVDVLAYSRVVASGPTLMPIDLGPLLRDIVEHHTELRAPHARVTIDIGHTRVLGNEAALMQCFTNLLANAAKFVAPGVTPEIHISVTTNAGRVRVLVRDNGIGIAPGAHERIFRLFERLNRNYEGTGVGLAIVKKSAERFGGSVGVTSAPGQGSTFWVELAVPPGEGRG